MSSGMPELGSKISLISKADIRYEGRLFTVDPQECTIALATVRSFGTEDRETQYPVPAQSQVYDYILFRGSDIKDIRVINNVPPVPNDPAIMQLSVPPSLSPQQYPSQGFGHPVLGAIGAQLSHFGGGYMAGLAPGMGAIGSGPINRGMGNKQSTSVLDLIGGGSRSATPASLNSRKSPTADQAVQVAVAAKDDKRVQRPIRPPVGAQRDRPDYQPRDRPDYQPRDRPDYQPRDRPDYQPRGENVQSTSNAVDHPRNQNYHMQPTRSTSTQFSTQRQQWGPVPRGQIRSRGPRQPRNLQPSLGYAYKQVSMPQSQLTNKPKSTLKFDNDYDFEQANTQFEELRSQLEKVKIKDGKPEVNGECEKKDDSGNETGVGEGEQEEDDQIFYDKAKSFFDNISCEAVERSKGRSQRTDWRTERKLNSETFGVSSTRRTGYRGGRGGFYNRGGYRPNFRGGYRPQTNQNNRRYVQNPTQNQESAQESTSTSTTTTTQPSASISTSNTTNNKATK